MPYCDLCDQWIWNNTWMRVAITHNGEVQLHHMHNICARAVETHIQLKEELQNLVDPEQRRIKQTELETSMESINGLCEWQRCFAVFELES